MLKLEIADPFLSDEHTAAEGAYVRLLKARKWLYMVSATAVLHAHEAISYKALSITTKGLLQISSGLAGAALSVTLIPLVLQYGLLLVQLVASYRVIIAERILRRAEEAMDRARESTRQAAAELQTLEMAEVQDEINADALAVRYVEEKKRLSVAQRDVDLWVSRDRDVDTGHPEYITLRRLLTNAQNAYEKVEKDRGEAVGILSARRDEIAGAKVKLELERQKFARLVKYTPELRPSFVWPEYALDACRVGLPGLAAIYALVALLSPSWLGVAAAESGTPRPVAVAPSTQARPLASNGPEIGKSSREQAEPALPSRQPSQGGDPR